MGMELLGFNLRHQRVVAALLDGLRQYHE